jgi:hypothetical protein
MRSKAGSKGRRFVGASRQRFTSICARELARYLEVTEHPSAPHARPRITRRSKQGFHMLNEKQVIDEAERSIIRSAIYSLPRSWKLIGLVAVVIAAYFFGAK